MAACGSRGHVRPCWAGAARSRAFHRRSMRFGIHFHHADEDFAVSARDAGTWEAEPTQLRAPVPPYPIVSCAGRSRFTAPRSDQLQVA
jgi:hypothetical protein